MVSPVKKNSISFEIADRIMASIMCGELKPGDRLPSERELAETFQVSRTSVREAIKLLSFSKIVESHPGAGTYVLNIPLEPYSSTKTTFINDPLIQSLEIRMIMEPKIIRLAAIYVTDEELKEFDSLLEEMQHCAEANEYGSYALLDLRFHYMCAKASKNPDLYNTLKKYCGSPQHVTSFGRKLNAELPTYIYHRKLVEALHMHDPDLAEKTMCEHIFFAFKKSTNERTYLLFNERIRLLSSYSLD